jgi:hypothetical protein
MNFEIKAFENNKHKDQDISISLGQSPYMGTGGKGQGRVDTDGYARLRPRRLHIKFNRKEPKNANKIEY